ncbi:MAG TPA: hypothetical protein VFC34_16630 [Puia sp.]|nr:hypothetical protein [Puia sp.]
MGQAFEKAAMDMMDTRPDHTREKYPELVQWKDIKDKARNPVNPVKTTG